MAVARVTLAWLRRGVPGASSYVRGSFGYGDPLYGPADLDLVVVVPGSARPVVRHRWERLAARIPLLADAVDVAVYEEGDLLRASSATVLTEGLRAVAPADDHVRLRIRPGPYGPAQDWRLLSGVDRRARPARSCQDRRLAAWLELQWWWRYAVSGCRDPDRLHIPYLCVKLVAESARVWLALEGQRQLFTRREALEQALAAIPDEEDALVRMLAVERRLPRSPKPPLREALAFLTRMTGRVARRFEVELAAEGETEVRLVGIGEELALAPEAAGAPLLPLADWRALTGLPYWRGELTGVLLPDEAMALGRGDPADPEAVVSAASSARHGVYTALRGDGFLLLPADTYVGGLYRSPQCRLSDPVSFALLDGRETALFPRASGWSAADWARRAVAAQSAWLRRRPADEGPKLGLLLSAARAALMLEALEDGEPSLAVTLGGAVALLAERHREDLDTAGEALEAFREWRRSGKAPRTGLAEELGSRVARLGPYRPGSVAAAANE